MDIFQWNYEERNVRQPSATCQKNRPEVHRQYFIYFALCGAPRNIHFKCFNHCTVDYSLHYTENQYLPITFNTKLLAENYIDYYDILLANYNPNNIYLMRLCGKLMFHIVSKTVR